MKRRRVLQRLLQTSGGLIGAYLMASCDRTPQSPFLPNLLTPTEPLPDHLITPLSEFYVQSYGLPVSVNADQWQLEITGAIATPLKLSYKDVLAAPQDNFYLTMECIGNPAGGNQIGNALWKGTPLLPFLQKQASTQTRLSSCCTAQLFTKPPCPSMMSCVPTYTLCNSPPLPTPTRIC